MEHLGSVQTWLINSYNIKVSPDWLTACLEWIAHESEDQPQSEEVVKQQVFEQWLTSDLAEIGEPSLPVAAMTCNKMELISNYALQIISIVDVGFPLYGQQQKLVGRENGNAEVSADKPFQPAWEPKQSRMLLLTLTDGHSEIKAMEYQPIRSLHSHLPSGTKCVMSGTVLCRRGMVLLTEEHIHLLGGEVDTLTEANTPLIVLQQAMEMYKEDDGKHAKQEFSGSFITRCSNKKLDLQKKGSMMKKEGSGSNVQQTNQFQAFSQVRMKREMKRPISPVEKVKTEPVKTEQCRIGHSRGSSNQQETEEEWGDDINYSDLFDNDMEFDDGPGVDQNSFRKADPDVSNSRAKISPGMCSAWMGDRHNSTNKVKSTTSSLNMSISNKEAIDVFDDDEDMEIENIFDNSSPSWHPGLQKSSFKQSSSNDLISGKASSWIDKPSIDRPNVQASRTRPVSAKQEVLSQNPKDCSSQIPNQHEQMKNSKPQSLSPTFSSPVSSNTQVPSQIKKPLFKVEKQCSSREEAPVQTSFSQAKKPKVQAKLSDLFRKQSKSTGNNLLETLGRVGGSVSQSSCDKLSAGNSGDMKRSSSQETTFIPSPHTLGKPTAPDCGPEPCQDLKGLPRAVIQPFEPASSTDQVCDNSSPYSLLSDLPSSSAGSITVKVSILTLIEKLCSNNGSHWSLACKVKDSTTSLDVDISNGVLTGLIGFSAEDSIAMRQRFKSEPDVKEVFAEGLSQCQNKLISGRGGCVVELEPVSCNPRGKRPVIANFHLCPR